MANYVEQLGNWVKQKKSTPRNKNLVAFLAVRNDIEAALQAGFPVKTVWENMRELQRIEFGYDTFLNYVNRFIRQSKSERISVSVEKPPSKKTGSSENPLETPSGFIFNPMVNKEDLI
ncbi:MAG: TraK family protein [Tatlockia sp.]|nr:TraK family protein [Tatlockia sp.]